MEVSTCAAQHFGAWACEPKWLRQALAAVQSGTWVPSAARIGPMDPNAKPYAMGGANSDLAVISIAGQMTKGQSSFGGASTVMARRALRAAADDTAVRGILLVIDSPGGSVSGTGDLGDDVAAIKKKKPVYAYIEDLGASAAYWVACQATRVYANPTAEVGSIGVFCVLEDSTGQQKADGVKLTVVSSAELKGAGADGKISDDLIADVQREIDAINQQFMGAVARGRSLTAKQVSDVATGQVWIANEAMKLGLIDQVASVDAAMTALSGKVMQMTKEQFESALAEHPEWIAGEREKAKKLGASEARALEIARAKAVREACAGNDSLAMDTFVAGNDAEDAAVSAAAIKKANAAADARIAEQAKEIEKLKTQLGTQGAVPTGNAHANAQKEKAAGDGTMPADLEPAAQAAWEWENKKEMRNGFSTKERFIAIRTQELKGSLKVFQRSK